MSFEGWWRRVLLVAAGIGRVIGFVIGAKILLAAPQGKVDHPWLWLVALTLMGVAGAGIVEKALTVFADFLSYLRTPPVARPPEATPPVARPPEAGSDDSGDTNETSPK